VDWWPEADFANEKRSGACAELRHKKRPGNVPDLGWSHTFDSASTSVVKGKQIPYLSSLEIASRHFARLVVALKVVAQLLAFNDFAHTCTLYSGDVYECVCAAVVWLNEAEALGGVKPFYCACGHNEPFQSISDRSQN
jgi:hypothetical protein